MRFTLTLCILAAASQAGAASITYDLVNYAVDQNGATLSGYFTVRQDIGILSIDDVQDWQLTITQPGAGTYTTGMGDPSAMLQPSGEIRLSPTEMTIAPRAGILFIQSDEITLIYSRSPDQYNGAGGSTISWMTNSPSMGGTEPWVIARTLGAPAVPEPSALVLSGIAVACLGAGMLRRRFSA